MAAVEFDACQKEADPSLAVNIHRNVADGSRTTDLRCPRNVGSSLNFRRIAVSQQTTFRGQLQTLCLQFQYNGEMLAN